MSRAALAVVLLLAAGANASAAPPARKRPAKRPSAVDAEGRSHLKKANALAAHGDCKQAIDEYTLAYDRLNDPSVLLARAECRQRAGESADAVEDYRAYLDEAPDDPDRAEIKAKIARLEGGPATQPAPATEPPPVPKAAPRPVEPPPPPAPVPTLAQPAPQVPPPALVVVAPAPVVVVSTQPEAVAATGGSGASHRKLWLWTAVGVAVAAGAITAGYLYFRPAEPATPPTALGNYRF